MLYEQLHLLYAMWYFFIESTATLYPYDFQWVECDNFEVKNTCKNFSFDALLYLFLLSLNTLLIVLLPIIDFNTFDSLIIWDGSLSTVIRMSKKEQKALGPRTVKLSLFLIKILKFGMVHFCYMSI